MRAELWGAPGANLGWELGEMGGWDISPSGFSLALLPFAVGEAGVWPTGLAAGARVCLWRCLESTCQR